MWSMSWKKSSYQWLGSAGKRVLENASHNKWIVNDCMYMNKKPPLVLGRNPNGIMNVETSKQGSYWIYFIHMGYWYN